MVKDKITLNWPILGNGHIVDFLAKSLAGDRIAGAYIFTGPDKLGKHTVASFFAYSLLCQNRGKAAKLPCGECPACRQHLAEEVVRDEDSLASVHADFHLLRREKDKKNISIEQVRDFIRVLGMSSFLNSYKVGIVKHAETLTEEAANALLKTLEEPKDKVVIILIASDLEALPETIISRSQALKFYPVKTDTIYDYLISEHGASRSAAKNFSRLSLGRPALAVKLLEDEKFYAKYVGRAEVFLNFFRHDLATSFAAIGEILGEKASGNEAAKIAKRILEVWQGVARDLILASYGQEDLIQHEVMLKEIVEQGRRLNVGALLALAQSLRRAEEYLASNVNPKLVLEQIAMAV